MSDPVIRTEGLTRRYGPTLAVDHVDLRVERGEIYGFLGRNGAGKTTLIRLLLGLIRPTRGTVRILDQAVGGRRDRSGAPWSRVGYLVEAPGLYPDLTVLDHLRLAASYRRLGEHPLHEVLDLLKLHRYRAVRAKALSMGNKQRLGLALAVVHRPDLLILDEPVNGLDPAGVVDVRGLLRQLADAGTTVFMSTHLISEVSKLADRVGIIHEGRLLEELSSQRLRAADQPDLEQYFLRRTEAASLEDGSS